MAVVIVASASTFPWPYTICLFSSVLEVRVSCNIRLSCGPVYTRERHTTCVRNGWWIWTLNIAFLQAGVHTFESLKISSGFSGRLYLETTVTKPTSH